VEGQNVPFTLKHARKATDRGYLRKEKQGGGGSVTGIGWKPVIGSGIGEKASISSKSGTNGERKTRKY